MTVSVEPTTAKISSASDLPSATRPAKNKSVSNRISENDVINHRFMGHVLVICIFIPTDINECLPSEWKNSKNAAKCISFLMEKYVLCL